MTIDNTKFQNPEYIQEIESLLERAEVKYREQDYKGAETDWFRAAGLGSENAVRALKELIHPNVQELIDKESDDPNKDSFSFTMRCIFLEKVDPLAAIEGFTELLKIEPLNCDHLISIAKINRRLLNRNNALDALNKAIEINPEKLVAYGERGLVHYILDNLKLAVEDFNQELEFETSDSIDRNHQDFIEDLLAQLLSQNPDVTPQNARNYFIRGKGKLKYSNDYQGAIDDLKTSSKLGFVHDQLGILLSNAMSEIACLKEESGDFEEAIRIFTEAIQIAPNNKNLYFNRGNARCYLEKYKDAIDDYSKAIKIDPLDAYAYAYRASAKRDFNDFSEALIDYNKAIEIDPNISSFYLDRAACKARSKDFDNAKIDYTKAIELDSENMLAFRGRGLCKEILNEIEGANQDWKRAADLGDEYSMKKLNQL